MGNYCQQVQTEHHSDKKENTNANKQSYEACQNCSRLSEQAIYSQLKVVYVEKWYIWEK